MSSKEQSEMILPGEWLGMLGGGQLGRMFTHAAQRLGYHVAVFDPQPGCPAAQAADLHYHGQHAEQSSDELMYELAKKCEVVSVEFENVEGQLLRQASRFTLAHPSPDFLEICQNRLREKSSLQEAGFPTTPFRAVKSVEDVKVAGADMGWPLVLKTATSGYDGKGQVQVKSGHDVEDAWAALKTNRVIAEQWIEYDAEVSMIVARNLRGEMKAYPLLENEHEDHILDVTRCPVSLPLKELEAPAQEIAFGIAESFGVVGLFCVEFFVTRAQDLLINEIAPRPHNSGHLTIEACVCSQFEQQVRAICNLPLGSTDLVRPAAMANLLGDVWLPNAPDWKRVFDEPTAFLHLYGKDPPKSKRKMGHITVLDESSSEAAITARELRDAIQTR